VLTRGSVCWQVFTTEGAPNAVPGKKDSRSEQLCTLLDLALALAPGVNADGINTLFQAAETTLQVGRLSPQVSILLKQFFSLPLLGC
jgi:hypothetical protein